MYGKELLCFQHLSESRFFLEALHRRSEFANFCHDFNAKPIVVIFYPKKFYSSDSFLKEQIFSHFSHSKNECKLCRNLQGR